MTDRSIIDVGTDSLARWSGYLTQGWGPEWHQTSWLVDLVTAMQEAEPYTPPARRALSVVIDWLDRDGVARQRVIVAEGTTTATTDLPSGFDGIVRVSVGGALVGPGWVTPEEWGPIPARCKVWPWDGCPDCNRPHGDLHTHECGALDRGEDE